MLFRSKYKINKEKNLALYNELKSKVNESIFQYKVNDSIKTNINNNIELFNDASVYKQSLFLEQFINLFTCKYGNVDLTLIKSPKKADTPIMSKSLNSNIVFIYQSITGIYESRKKVEV